MESPHYVIYVLLNTVSVLLRFRFCFYNPGEFIVRTFAIQRTH